MSVSEQDRARIAEAIRAAEAKTSGEIVCVLARSSVEANALPVFLAALAALALPWALVALTAWPLGRILALQALLFALLVALLSLPAVRIALVPRAVRRRLAEQAALAQFQARGIARTRNRTGILIFVSLAERYARIVADEGIAARVPQSAWQEAVDGLVAEAREGRIAEGFVAAIGRCGAVLAAHFPPAADNRDELRDRIYIV